ncbi:DUF2637 domain-containing protein [Streptomyces sp. AK02-01A]|uniref:DUF2637 domain-containing protein n=1 Tax=Streptomyces sp. AK02-01A TaxID=3028648 RepID=UPI0029A9BCBC|nr:DUF2637 domain-containing protein [Streptomyces sp. AK02-01A]MDX3854874.1 DUF2637 domain-containing protein [Streptomyces sp. AK02-01A]
MTHPSPTPVAVAPIGNWDRLAIIALGSAGCALSYDALQQMAVAIHVRGLLTYLFPLVIDGFIAYGVRALLVLSAAPLRARAYVWMLFGTATTASIWANSLHAVRLNQQTTPGGLRLGDTVVAILSTLAPLALAGAVHLYILITRHRPPILTGTEAGPTGDRATTVPSPPHSQPGPGSPRDQARHGDRPSERRPGPALATGFPAGRDPDPASLSHNQGHSPSPARRAELADREGGTNNGTMMEGAETAVVSAARPHRLATVADSSVPDNGTDEPADTVPVTDGSGDGPRVPRPDGGDRDRAYVDGDGPRAGTVPNGGDRDQAGTVPGTVPNKDVPRTRQSGRRAEGTGDRSPMAGVSPSPSRARFSEDEIVARIRPHVPAVLARSGNEAITRVQLRQIMRDQQISIRNENLTPVLRRLRSESGSNAKRSSTR